MDEYINRKYVLNLIEHNNKVCHYADDRYENVVYATTQAICKVVAEMPAADVKPVKHGRWIPDKNPYGKYFCSECNNAKITFKEKYCSNCGARMDLKEGEKNAD